MLQNIFYCYSRSWMALEKEVVLELCKYCWSQVVSAGNPGNGISSMRKAALPGFYFLSDIHNESVALPIHSHRQ